ncbi:MAG: hypothetical protein AB1726_09110 [Planctomycetota bacterium]
MKRHVLLVLVPLSILAMMTEGKSATVASSSQGLPLKKSLTVHVADGFSGEPIVGAPVQRIGDSYLRTTDSKGEVTFTQIPSGVETTRVWCTPDGYSPGFGEFPLDSQVNLAVITPIPEDRFSTGLISASSGGSFVLAGTVGPGLDIPFTMEIVVPPGALLQDATISVSPYPVWAAGTQGIDDDGFPFGKFHATLRDASGAKIVEEFLAPVTFKIRAWQMPTPGEFDGLDPSWAVLYRYDYAAHEFALEPTTFSVDAANDLLVFEVWRLSVFAEELAWKSEADYSALWDWLFSDDDEEDKPPTMPPPALSVTETLTCETRAYGLVECGSIMGGGADWSAETGTEVTVSTQLETELSATYGTEVGTALAKVSTQIQARLTISVGGSVTGHTTVSVGGSWQGGDPVTAQPCYDGTIEGILVWKVYTLSAAGHELGTISVPFASARKRNLVWNSACPDCAGLPQGMPILDKTPCDE